VDQQQVLSVELPRDWTGSRTGDGWQPPGATARLPGLLVSADNNGWSKSDAKVPGVFAGVLPPGELPAATTLPGPAGCAESAERVDKPFTATAKYVGCPAGMTTYERVQQIDGALVRIQVRAEDGAQAERVLDSVAYKPSK
jgi:hypothetical protein